MTFLQQHHDADRDDRFGHREDAKDRIFRHRGGLRRILPAKRIEPADLAAARHHHRDARQRSLVDLALEDVRHAPQALMRQPDQFRLCLGKRWRLWRGGTFGGGLRGHFLILFSRWSFSVPFIDSLAEAARLGKISLGRAGGCFALAIRPQPMLETARGVAAMPLPLRSVAQLVEHRSPKPGVAGSSPATPANKIKGLGRDFPSNSNCKNRQRVNPRGRHARARAGQPSRSGNSGCALARRDAWEHGFCALEGLSGSSGKG